MTFTEMPVAAMDSMMTQGMVSNAPTAVTARTEYQGVCVGQAHTAAMDMAKPKAKTIAYCSYIGEGQSRDSSLGCRLRVRVRAVQLTHHSGTSLYRRIMRAWPSSKPV